MARHCEGVGALWSIAVVAPDRLFAIALPADALRRLRYRLLTCGGSVMNDDKGRERGLGATIDVGFDHGRRKIPPAPRAEHLRPGRRVIAGPTPSEPRRSAPLP